MSTSTLKISGVSRSKSKFYNKQVQAILELRETFKDFKDEDILKEASKAKELLKQNLNPSELNAQKIIIFALASEASKRALGQTPYAVQILGGLVISDGAIAEMATGEGKTLTAVAPVAWWAFHGKGVHVATANEYLASRDAKELEPVYSLLGLTVEYTNRDHALENRKKAYASDITYATAQTLGFDYLTDNLIHNPEDGVRRKAFAAVIDEADSLLIDEARTPLVISAPNAALQGGWEKYAQFVKTLTLDTDYEIDKSENFVILTEEGADKAEAFFNVKKLYDDPEIVSRILTSIRAEALLIENKDYIVSNGEVLIVDENTGRVLGERRFQDGIHEALEAKENLPSKAPNVNMASVTLQSFFGMYPHLGGMTGTALTDAEELNSTYGTLVVGIPTHKPKLRNDLPDLLFKDADQKFVALAQEIKTRSDKGQPVLVGTSSVEESENISAKLNALGIKHSVLNARSSEKESEIIAQAGRRGAVTISTNMAGRGVDIKLGGQKQNDSESNIDFKKLHEEIVNLGGLAVLSTSRASSRRVDNQLKGRSGRQGEPGETQFFLAGDDELITTFGGTQVSSVLGALSGSSDGPITHPALSKILEKSQRKVESMHADARQSLIEFDGVHTAQRNAFYIFRENLLHMSFDEFINTFTFKAYSNQVKTLNTVKPLAKIKEAPAKRFLNASYPREIPSELLKGPLEDLISFLATGAGREFSERFTALETDDGTDLKTTVMRRILMDMLDQFWTRHLTQMENLQGAVALRRYAQVDPKIAFAQEAKILYKQFLSNFYQTAMSTFWGLRLAINEKTEEKSTEEEPVEEPVSNVNENVSEEISETSSENFNEK